MAQPRREFRGQCRRTRPRHPRQQHVQPANRRGTAALFGIHAQDQAAEQEKGRAEERRSQERQGQADLSQGSRRIFHDERPRQAERSEEVIPRPLKRFLPLLTALALLFGCGPKTELEQLQRRAAKGDAQAQFDLGAAHANIDPAEAAKWFSQAAARGHVEAQFFLGDAFEKGLGVKQDFTEAAAWYRKAAEQGSPAAQINLGTLHLDGHGVKQDVAEAARWFRRAAGQGDVAAQFNCGLANAEGKGVRTNNVEAYFWFTLASRQGHQNAAGAREQISQLMSPDQIFEASQRAQKFAAVNEIKTNAVPKKRP
ncbi:MAG: sel1 repeat family protein [Pedosphaera sp.]|nr:sel1 repeat family protein [Pedosphaera sp.]